MSDQALSKVQKYLKSGTIIDVKSNEGVIIRAKNATPRHAITEADGCLMSVSLMASPDSVLTSLIQVCSESFAPVLHLII